MAMNASDVVHDLLTHNIEDNIETSVESATEKQWGKSLADMPLFTIKEIELHRQSSGKFGVSIIKTLDRGRKFKDERYISADTLFTASLRNDFYVKCKCKSSMKKEFRSVEVALSRTSGAVSTASCSCPAGLSGYCNHVMALLFELADYSLNQLVSVPEEISCTSQSRQWGIPSENQNFKEPVMTSPVICNNSNKRGIGCTIYDPRRKISTPESITKFQTQLQQNDIRIGFAHCIDPSLNKSCTTKYGEFIIGSTLSHQLLPLESHLQIITNMLQHNSCIYTEHGYYSLPLSFLSDNDIPSDLGYLTYREMMFLDTVKISEEDSFQIEEDTILQSSSPKWHDETEKM